MERQQALAIAQDRFDNYNAALWNFWIGKGLEPIGSDYGYHHGWMTVGEFHFSPDEVAPGPTYDGA